MHALRELLSINILIQGVLLALCWWLQNETAALHEFYQFSPGLTWFYGIGALVFVAVAYSSIRATVLQSGFGKRVRRAARTQGH